MTHMNICDPMIDPYNQAGELRKRLSSATDAVQAMRERMDDLEHMAVAFGLCISYQSFPERGSPMHLELLSLLNIQKKPTP